MANGVFLVIHYLNVNAYVLESVCERGNGTVSCTFDEGWMAIDSMVPWK
jgi:hypothetical protein